MMSYFFKQKGNTEFQRSIIKHRQLLRNLKNKNGAVPVDINYFDMECSIEDAACISMRIYRPQNANKNSVFPTIFFITGTAFVGREMAYTHVICSMLAKFSKSQVILIHHRLSPEYQFPVPRNDVVAVMKKLIKHAKQMHIDKSKIILSGYSSGANLAVTAAMKMKGAISRLILVSPLVDLARTLNKFHKFEVRDGSLPKGFTDWFLDLYIPESTYLKDPRLSPFWSKKLHKLKSAYVLFGEFDRFRSDAEALISKLKNKKVSAKKFMFVGEDHGCLWNNQRVVEAIAIISQQIFATISIPKAISCNKKKAEENINVTASIFTISNKESKRFSREM